MERQSRKGRIECGRKGSVPFFFTLPLSFHSFFVICSSLLPPIATYTYTYHTYCGGVGVGVVVGGAGSVVVDCIVGVCPLSEFSFATIPRINSYN